MIISTMASAISPPPTPSSLQPCIGKKPSLFILSKPPKIPVSQLGFPPSSQWINGRKQISIARLSAQMRRKGKGRGKHRGVYASLFGVGAPEVLVIGVVALLVFGPKGLAEAARSLGKTIRSFQPAIRELQEVSREFKSSLQREIGLDEINNPAASNRFGSNTPNLTSDTTRTNVEPSESPQGYSAVTESGAYTADEYLKVTEEQLKAALARVQTEQQDQDQIQPQTASDETETPEDDGGLQVPPKPKSDM